MTKYLLAFCLYCCCNVLTAAAQKPGSCKVEGKIVSVVNKLEKDTGSICSKYPCRAKVKILDVSECGSSIAYPLHVNDIVEMRFEYTLHSTATILPAMKVHFPGLKKGDRFITRAEQRLKMGSNVEWVVYGYSKQKPAKQK